MSCIETSFVSVDLFFRVFMHKNVQTHKNEAAAYNLMGEMH